MLCAKLTTNLSICMVQWRWYPAAPQVTNANSRLTACLMNLPVNWLSWPVVLIPSRCFSHCPSATLVFSPPQLPIEQQFLITSLRIIHLIHRASEACFLSWCHQTMGQQWESWCSSDTDLNSRWHCSYLSQNSVLHSQQRVLITSSQSS